MKISNLIKDNGVLFIIGVWIAVLVFISVIGSVSAYIGGTAGAIVFYALEKTFGGNKDD